MAKTDLNIKTLDSNQKTTNTKISYINPNATGAQLLALTNAIVGLSNNTLADATITKSESVLDYDPETPKTEGLITLTTSTMTIAAFKAGFQSGGQTLSAYTYNGDGIVGVQCSDQNIFTSTSDNQLRVYMNSAAIAGLTAPITFTVYAPETDNYTAAVATFTVTA